MDTNTITDEVLLTRFLKNNDEAAFSEIVKRHSGLVYRVCFRILNDHQESEDASQAVFAILLKRARSIKKRQSLGSWLHKVARTTALYSLRKKISQNKREEEWTMTNETDPPDINDSQHASTLAGLDDAIAKLSERQREAVVLRYLEGHSVEVASTMAGCSFDVLVGRTQAGINKLRKYFARRDKILSGVMLVTILQSEAQAAIPQTLIPTIVTASKLVAAGTATGAVSGSVATLVQEITKIQTMIKIKIAGIIAAAAVSVGIGVGTLSASLDGDVQVLGAGSFQTPGEIRSVAMSPDSQFLATGGSALKHGKDSVLQIWDIKTMTVVKQIPHAGEVTDIKYDSSGKRLYFLTMVNSGDKDRMVAWDLTKNKLIFEVPLANYYGSIELNEDKKAVVSVLGPIGDFGRNLGKNVMAWDMDTGKELKTWEGLTRKNEEAPKKPGRSYKVELVTCSPDGQKLFCADSNSSETSSQASILDWKTGKLLHRYTLDRCFLATWLPGGKTLLINQEIIIDAMTGKELHRLPIGAFLNHDRTKILSYANNKLIRYSSKTFEPEWDITVPGESIKYLIDMQISSDRRWLFAAIGNSMTPFIFDLKNKKLIAPQSDAFQATPSINYTPDGRLLAYDNAQTRFIDKDGKLLTSTKMHMQSSYWENPEWSQDGRFVLESARGAAQLWDTKLGLKTQKLTSSKKSSTNRAFLSPDMKYAATFRRSDGLLEIHDLPTNKVISKIQGPKNKSSRRLLKLAGLFWDTPRQHVAIGDNTLSVFNRQDDFKEMGSFGTIGVAGIIDIQTGKRLHRFLNADGEPALNVTLLACANDLIYGKASFAMELDINGHARLEAQKHCLWRLSDGAFIRYMSDVGNNIKFSKKGTWIYGLKGIAYVRSGSISRNNIRAVNKKGFGPHSHIGGILNTITNRVLVLDNAYYSPSYSLIAKVDEHFNLNIYNADTHYLLWRQALSLTPDDKDLAEFVWHPAEARVAFTVEGELPVRQVELFTPVKYPKSLTLETSIAMLRDKSIQKRMEAASYLLAQGEKAVAPLLKCCEKTEEYITLQQVMSITLLEQIARAKIPAARRVLEELRLPTVGSALERLDAFTKVEGFRTKNAAAKPLK